MASSIIKSNNYKRGEIIGVSRSRQDTGSLFVRKQTNPKRNSKMWSDRRVPQKQQQTSVSRGRQDQGKQEGQKFTKPGKHAQKQ